MRYASISAVCAIFCSATVWAVPTTPKPGYVLSTATTGVNSTFLSSLSQLAFKPGDPYHLYAARGSPANVVTRFDYNPVTATLSNPFNVLNLNTLPSLDTKKAVNGIGFHGDDLWVTRWPGWTSDRPGTITRFQDADGNGTFDPNSAAERLDVLNVGQMGVHTINQIQIVGDSLYTTVGTRTNTGNPASEDIFNGTVIRIGDITNPVPMNLNPGSAAERATFLDSSISDGSPRIFAKGFRNAYGIRAANDGTLWLADNGANSETGFDETFDLFYRNVGLNDVGHFPPQTEYAVPDPTVDPVAVVGSHKGSAGFDFISRGPDKGKAVLALSPNNSNGRRLALIDPSDGGVTNFLTGFSTATDVVVDPVGRLLAGDWDQNAIYAITPPRYGDANLDRKVDVLDTLALSQNWLQPGTWANGDFDGNGFVDAADLGLLGMNWLAGVTSPIGTLEFSPGLSAAIPEPNVAALFLVGVIVAGNRRFRRGFCS